MKAGLRYTDIPNVSSKRYKHQGRIFHDIYYRNLHVATMSQGFLQFGNSASGRTRCTSIQRAMKCIYNNYTFKPKKYTFKDVEEFYAHKGRLNGDAYTIHSAKVNEIVAILKNNGTLAVLVGNEFTKQPVIVSGIFNLHNAMRRVYLKSLKPFEK